MFHDTLEAPLPQPARRSAKYHSPRAQGGHVVWLFGLRCWPQALGQSYYCYFMRPIDRKVARIGPKLSWDDTARAIANELEDWSAWDQTLSDGLDRIPWEPRPARRVADGG
jgi:hypothetical protein